MGALRAGMALFAVLWLSVGAVSRLKAEVLFSPLNGLVVAKQRASAIGCADHLKTIMLSAHTWATDNCDTPPPDLAALTNGLGSPATLFCPANQRVRPPTNWAELNWDQIDYAWNTNVDWSDPVSVACVCRVHESAALMEGSVKTGPYRQGWPWITAGPVEALATPGEKVCFEVKVSATALQPLSYQWRREAVHSETNVVRVENRDDPREIYWQTNVVPVFTATALPEQTNTALVLSGVQTNDSGYYSVAVSNVMGVAVSPRGVLHVDASFAGVTTSEPWSRLYCVNNLQMLALLGQLWACDHEGQSPRSLATMTNSDGSWMFGWPASLFCRSDTARVAPTDWPDLDFSNTSYEMWPLNVEDPTAVFCICRFHGFYAQLDQQVAWRPSFRGIQRLADGTTTLRFRLFAGATNLLEASTDLTNWTTLTNHPGAIGEFQFTDAETTAQRLYRLRLP